MNIKKFIDLSLSEFEKDNYETSFSLACQALDIASKMFYPKLKMGIGLRR